MEKEILSRFQRGQRIKARVVELQLANQLIVSFQGRLLRVVNTTDRTFRIDDVLDLQVVAIDPLEFRIYQKSQSFDRLI